MKLKAIFILAVQACVTTLSLAEPVNYVIDPTHTFVNWEARHFGVSTSRGRFDKTGGAISFDEKTKVGKVDLIIDMKSISTGVAPFDAHLRRDDYFDVEHFPEARFVSNEFRFERDKLIEVAGHLTMRGITKPVTLAAKRFSCYENPFVKREVCAGDFEATVVRSQYGMVHGFPTVVPDDAIRLQIQVEAIRQ